jgi:hypothetical protein
LALVPLIQVTLSVKLPKSLKPSSSNKGDVNLDFFLRQIKPPDVQEKYMIEEKEATEHGVTLVDAPLLLKSAGQFSEIGSQ